MDATIFSTRAIRLFLKQRQKEERRGIVLGSTSLASSLRISSLIPPARLMVESKEFTFQASDQTIQERKEIIWRIRSIQPSDKNGCNEYYSRRRRNYSWLRIIWGASYLTQTKDQSFRMKMRVLRGTWQDMYCT